MLKHPPISPIPSRLPETRISIRVLALVALLAVDASSASPKSDTSGSIVPYLGFGCGIGMGKALWKTTQEGHPKSSQGTGPSGTVSLGIRHDTLPFFAETEVAYWSHTEFAELSMLSMGGKVGFEIAQTSPLMGRLGGTLGWFKSSAKKDGSGMYFGGEIGLFSNSPSVRHGITLSFLGTGVFPATEVESYSGPTLTTTYVNTGAGTGMASDFKPGQRNGKVPVDMKLSEVRILYTLSFALGRSSAASSMPDSTQETVRFQ